MEKTIDYYISFYQAIPDDRWCTGVFITDEGSCCALGHLGEREDAINRKELIEFRQLLDLYGSSDHSITDVNDGADEFLYLGDTPKERVINFLKQLKDDKRG